MGISENTIRILSQPKVSVCFYCLKHVFDPFGFWNFSYSQAILHNYIYKILACICFKVASRGIQRSLTTVVLYSFFKKQKPES